jgi:2-dehydropantoate 2-reductase
MAEAEFAVVGAGAIGSILGAHLARAGHDVVMLARGERADRIEREGLQIEGLVRFSQRVRVLTDPTQLHAAETLIVATKTYATAAALASLREAHVGVAFSIQNGLMKNEQLAATWGRHCVVGALADTSGELRPSGAVLFTRNEHVLIGELSGEQSARTQELARLIDSAGVRASAVQDIQDLEWSKFAAWTGLMVLSLTMRTPTWQYLTDADSARVLARIVREIGILAAAHGISLSDRATLPVATIVEGSEEAAVAVIRAAGERFKTLAPTHRMSSLQDLEAGRPIEVQETLGYAVQLAEQAKLSLPLLASFHGLIASVDRIRRQPV